MAINPMQRKSRNSFLMGMVVMLLISGVIIGLLFMQLIGNAKKEKEDPKTNVYVLNQDVKSGQEITLDMLTKRTVNRSLVPETASGESSILSDYSLTDKEGNEIITEKNKDNEKELILLKDGKRYPLIKEDNTEFYYYNVMDASRNKVKKYVELTEVPLVAKVTMRANTVLTTELVSRADNVVKDDLRRQEYNIAVLPIDLQTGDYVDIRISLPNRQDYVIVSKKEVEIPEGTLDPQVFWANLTEDEILYMNCAIIDAAQLKGSKIYATKYTDPGMQRAAIPNFPIDAKTSEVLESNPNILNEAKETIRRRYANANSVKRRNDDINPALEATMEEAQGNIESKVDDSITRSITGRKDYLESLNEPAE